LIFFITLERSKTRQDKFESILEIKESVVSSPFVKAEVDSVDYVVLFETVCASSLAMCAYQRSISVLQKNLVTITQNITKS
jgi:hypothetical protein